MTEERVLAWLCFGGWACLAAVPVLGIVGSVVEWLLKKRRQAP